MSITTQQTYLPTQHQQGATLIIVLMVVLLLSLVGAIVVRNSQVSLNMTTSAQVNQLLAQSTDVPFAELEMTAAQDSPVNTGRTLLEDLTLTDAPIGRLTRNGKETQEYVLCYQPTIRNSLYEQGEHRIIVDVDPTIAVAGKIDGYCNIEDQPNTTYTSARTTVATQASITRPTITAGVVAPPLSAFGFGLDSASVAKDDPAYFRTTVTSVLPALSISTTAQDIQNCLALPISGNPDIAVNQRQLNCLVAEDVPVNIQVQDFVFIPESSN